jgi:hypothetical protein
VESVTAGVPVPLRVTPCGLFTASSLKVSEPANGPNPEGTNATPTVQVVPALMLAPHVLLTRLKFGPAAMLVKLSAELFRFVSVTAWLVLVLPPTTPFPKLKLLVESVTGAVPVPLRLIDCGLSRASSVNVRAPERAPIATGENTTLTVHDVPAAMLAPHVLLVIAKSPLVTLLVKLRGVFF